jgi:phosphoserine aminotransferase
MARVINFNAGPAGLPQPALERAQKELVEYGDAGMSVMEMSHRSPEYDAIHQEALALTKELLNVPDNYKIMLIQGGGNLQFGMFPMNVLHSGRKADYIVTGNWAKKAHKEAVTVAGDAVNMAASTEDENFTRLPGNEELKLTPGASYVHICSNNTIFGTQWKQWPETNGVPLAADMSSDIMWRPFDLEPFGMIYAGAQKNLGPSGVTMVIMRDDFLEMCRDDLTSYLKYPLHASKNSLFNTPPTFGIYLLRNVLDYFKSLGGLSAIEKQNERKAELLYGCIDAHEGFYTGTVKVKEHRSRMNVTFVLQNDDLTQQFIAQCKDDGIVGVKGYRTVGGIRVSMYNARTVADIETLVSFMEQFVKKNG